MKIRILSIDKRLDHESVTQAGFEDSLSFSDYDAVVIDPQQLSHLWKVRHPVKRDSSGGYFTNFSQDGGLASNFMNLFERRREEIETLLNITQGIVVCYIRNKETPLTLHLPGHIRLLNIYSWMPALSLTWQDDAGNTQTQSILFYDRLFLREGREIGFVDNTHPFSQYFDICKGSIAYESILKFGPELENRLAVISRNKVREIVSLEVRIGKGKIIFIPPNDLADQRKEAGVLFDCIIRSMDVGYESPPPDWIKRYGLPGEDKYSERINALHTKIHELTEEKNKLEGEQNRIARFKGLLYETGKRGLEPLVREAFRLIGFNVLEPDQYEESYDLYIKEKDIVLVGEMGATDNSQMDIDKYRQLLDHVENEPAEDITCKGILVANAFRETEPQDRKGQFTAHVIKACKRQRYCMITTETLYKIVKYILSNGKRLILEKLKADIIGCDQEFIFKEPE
jgi:hypothetical protein